MNNHLDEMKFFVEVVNAYSNNTLLESYDESSNTQELEKTSEIITDDLTESMINDLAELKESWLSINSNESDPSFSMGYEQGLYKAVEMLENLLSSKYDRRI